MKFNAILIDAFLFKKSGLRFVLDDNDSFGDFFKLLQENKIKLLSHPILRKQIDNDISSSKMVGDFESLNKSFENYKKVLNPDNTSINIELKETAVSEFEEDIKSHCNSFFHDSIELNWLDSKEIFEQYFANKSPFFNKYEKKKENIPDAFLIESLKNEVSSNRLSLYMVVTLKYEWAKALEGCNNVFIADSVDDAKTAVDKMVDSESFIEITKELKVQISSEIEKKVLIEIEKFLDEDNKKHKSNKFLSFGLENKGKARIIDLMMDKIDIVANFVQFNKDENFFNTKLYAELEFSGKYSKEKKNKNKHESSECEFEKATSVIKCEIAISKNFTGNNREIKIIRLGEEK